MTDDRDPSLQPHASPTARHFLEAQTLAIRNTFNHTIQQRTAGKLAVAARANVVDHLIRDLWHQARLADPILQSGVAILAVGGYGRSELFPSSDVDLMFLLDAKVQERAVKDPIRRLNQSLWDAGLRLSPMTRTLAECARFDPENVEFTLALLDARPLAGDTALSSHLIEKTVPRLISRDRKKIVTRLLQAIQTRHTRYGDTLFHLEPNVKECPGGLRDAHCCAWLTRLTEESDPSTQPLNPAPDLPPEFLEARDFLLLVRCFLHLRHGRDDNTLDWQTQDEAAAANLGIARNGPPLDASYWMRLYFRHARSIQRRIAQSIDELAPAKTTSRLASLANLKRPAPAPSHPGFELRHSRINLTQQGTDAYALPEHDPDVALAIFTSIARTGATLSRDTELRLEDALPLLSANLEDGPALWRHLQAILTGPFAGKALRAMHALGILELLIPEFHGIDALVIRDAYHRYTVDEHTFVLIDTLHNLSSTNPARLPVATSTFSTRFSTILHDLPHPELLFLAALLHDTGKGHAGTGHATESARLAKAVLSRLELDPYEANLVLDLIKNHLEMSATLRRDVFDTETIRTFAARVPTPEALRMLTLFTFSDIAAVHPDALTPWKAENLWRLYLATANFLDRNVDDERIATTPTELGEIMHRLHALLPGKRNELAHFLEGFPLRYLQTRTPDHIRTHFEMAQTLASTQNQLDFRYAPGLNELTLVTSDRPLLFASMAGALAAWGMNIVTADAFSNHHNIVVDSFRFTDSFRTLELNPSERDRFVASVRDVMSGKASLDALLASRRRARRKSPKVTVESRIDFDDSASSQSTLLQVVAQDTPGLLRALASTIANYGCNIEVALVDTEGEMAIDVFYITHNASKLEPTLEQSLRLTLLEAIEANAR